LISKITLQSLLTNHQQEMKLLFLACLLLGLTLSSAIDVELISRLRRVEKDTAQETSTAIIAAGASAAATKAICDNQPASCINFANHGNGFGMGGDGGGFAHEEMAADEAVQPVEDWLTNFQRRIGGGTLYQSAQAVVRPLIERLVRTQHRALEDLARSNEEIIAHVEESATNHVYNLLRATNIKQDKQMEDEEKKQKLQEIRDEIKQQQAIAKDMASGVGKSGSGKKGSGHSSSGGSKSSGSMSSVAAKEQKKLEDQVQKELAKSSS
jgi:hypothetical protein